MLRQTTVRSSDRRKLRAEVLEAYPALAAGSGGDAEEPAAAAVAGQVFVPSHGDLAAWKISTHAGDAATVYAVDGQPVLVRVRLDSVDDGGAAIEVKAAASTKKKQRQQQPPPPAPLQRRAVDALIPTVYALWLLYERQVAAAAIAAGGGAAAVEASTPLPCIATNSYVLGKLIAGADLMLPGVNARLSAAEWAAGQIACFCVGGVPVGVGVALVSKEEAERNGWKGRGFRTLHMQEDTLWAAGDRRNAPATMVSAEAGIRATLTKDTDCEKDAEVEEAVVSITDEYEVIEHDGVDGEGDGDEDGDVVALRHGVASLEGSMFSSVASLVLVDDAQSQAPTEPDGSAVEIGVAAEMAEAAAAAEAVDGAGGRAGAEAMDAQLVSTLLCALKLSPGLADARQFPVTASVLYSAHMMAYATVCGDTTMDVKRSSHRKLARFLKAMEKRGYVKLKERAGDLVVVSVNRAHPDVVAYQPPPAAKKVAAATVAGAATGSKAVEGTASASTAAEQKKPIIKVVELYRLNGNVAMLADALPINNGAQVSAADFRAVMEEYFKSNNLLDQDNPRLVRLDAVLAHTVLKKEERDVDFLTRDAITSRILERMSPFYEITLPGQDPAIRKGHLKPISVLVESRMGRKTVTRVFGIEPFGIDAEDLASVLRAKCAAINSITAGKAQGGMVTHEVMVQGTKAVEVCECLAERYGIPFSGGGGKGKAAAPTSKFVDVVAKA
ncbi:Eukaryotic translation initiation factor 2D [Cladochytrium tenue]|nr:Eukaryotic translation initiation factor 2D [Cladochytrium tenue]